MDVYALSALLDKVGINFHKPHKSVFFLGYSNNKKGYKVYNIETNTEIISKDVVFHERFFPYHYIKAKSYMNELKSFFLTECQEALDTTDQDIIMHDFNYLHDYTSVMTEQDNINNDLVDQNTSSTSENDKAIISTDLGGQQTHSTSENDTAINSSNPDNPT